MLRGETSVEGDSSNNVNIDVESQTQARGLLCKRSRLDANPSHNSIYIKAKSFFHRSASVRIVGRTVERAFIEVFWKNAFKTKTGKIKEDHPKVLYICGNPGTGKTALLAEMLPALAKSNRGGVNIISINCMMYTDPRESLKTIAQQLGVSDWAALGNDWSALSEKIIENIKSGKTLISFDEIDQIALKDQCLLEEIFLWPSFCKGKLAVVGIANALDLSIKHIRTRENQVSLLNFSPYSSEDISRILIDRLDQIHESVKENHQNGNELIIVEPVALEICARKVSTMGDLRKALEIMQKAVGIAQKSSPHTFQSIKVPHIIQAIEDLFSNTTKTTNHNISIIEELNLHQKLFLVTLYKCRSGQVKPSIDVLFKRYSEIVTNDRIMDAVGRSEFNDIITNTESMGIISILPPGKRKKVVSTFTLTGDHRVVLSVPPSDLVHAISSNPILSLLLDR